jgi:hypothetical protein
MYFDEELLRISIVALLRFTSLNNLENLKIISAATQHPSLSLELTPPSHPTLDKWFC